MELFIKNDKKLSAKEKNIIELIETNPVLFLENSAKEFAQYENISNSSLSKLVKKLGFEEISQFKFHVAKWYFSSKEKYESKNLSEHSRIKGFVRDYYHYTLDQTFNETNMNKIALAAKWISMSQFVITFGVGTSYLAAQDLSNNLNTLSYQSHHSNSVHDVALYLKKRRIKNYVAIIFSKSVSSKDIRSLINLLLASEIKTILITENKSFSEKSNEWFNVINFNVVEQVVRINPLSSKIGQFFISDTIVKTLETRTDIVNSDFYEAFLKTWRAK
ncbi:RpiR family transcriptional regulator [Mycoplasma testudineum]|uniref:RpiR family transcriptional regulator n=1 Tax=Mycoplasma testudineum TaxID=244584 RepID=A0A4R6IF75_9MOLU|nr:MurR/RpiR family transcriptional regulator [Mycoplasma testudineum]OYD26837.1 hypothetical protein CG473_01865 [Mycoplasma testudineum]TDO20371.1 RpiR family transcriptional regulator [Mycoplasma testudineum]